jgi:hypothetical protein
MIGFSPCLPVQRLKNTTRPSAELRSRDFTLGQNIRFWQVCEVPTGSIGVDRK